MSDTNGPKKKLVLRDEHGNKYTEEQISFLWENFSGKDGKKRLPKLREYNDDGTIKTEGAKLLIGFLNNDHTRPIILGCIENVAAQHTFLPAVGTTPRDANREVDINDNDEFRITRTVSSSGDVILDIMNKKGNPVKYHLSVNGKDSGIYINAEGNTYIGNDYNQIQFEDNNIFIGSRHYSGKAKEVGINAERVILGNSTFYNPLLEKHETEVDFPIDSNTQTTDFPSSLASNTNPPQHQWAVMGETLVYLINRLIYWWQNAKYMSGNTVCKVASDDYLNMKTEVLDKLILMLSSSVSLINKKEDPHG